MKVFKFGGASVKDANAVRNVANIINLYQGEKLAVVISAMGKTTNAMEKIAEALWNRNEIEFNELLDERRAFHLDIANDLFNGQQAIHSEINAFFEEITILFNQQLPRNYDVAYDQIASYGEILSTKIIAAYTASMGLNSAWQDARELIFTNNKHREAEIHWDTTTENFQSTFVPKLNLFDIIITQGFIGSHNGNTTTLGREGSDFTAGIIAYCTDAEDVTIWKDVPGMLNADPKWFDNTIKLEQISFREAIELSYYGASVIHPKTVKPLQNKNIPLHVKSFVNPEAEGTIIQESMTYDDEVPSFIFKMNQVLISITPKDFSFIVEKNLSDIFSRLTRVNAKINLMQNSALKFSILLDEDKTDIEEIYYAFQDNYEVAYNSGLELITIRHYDQDTIDRVIEGKDILLTQTTRETARLIVQDRIDI